MHLDPRQLQLDMTGHRQGVAEASDRLCAALRPVIHRETSRMLGDQDMDAEDVTQECLTTTLGYLEREQEFSGDLVRLSVTIARNRCRDILRQRSRRPQQEIESMADWLASPGASVLDEIAERDLTDILQRTLDNMEEACRRLLEALYIKGLSTEQVRVRIGLGTVQGVYQRRGVCLEKAKKSLQRFLRFGSWSGSDSTEHTKDPSRRRKS
jgi:RNA polymerase sigma factor (sigma-70 family)